MTKPRLRFLSVLLLAVPLGACGGTANRGLESVHQPIVQRDDYAFDVQTDRNGLAPGEAARLAGWMGTLRVGYGDHVALDTGDGYGGGAREQIATLVARYGLLLSDDVPVSGGAIAPGTARVVLSRMHAAVPGCPDWSRDSTNDLENNTSSNQGCAINSNLASMIANPADLVRGEPGSGTADPVTSGRAINAYRTASPSGAGGLSGASAASSGSSH